MLDGSNKGALEDIWEVFLSRLKKLGLYTFQELKEQLKLLEETMIAEGRLIRDEVADFLSKSLAYAQ